MRCARFFSQFFVRFVLMRSKFEIVEIIALTQKRQRRRFVASFRSLIHFDRVIFFPLFALFTFYFFRFLVNFAVKKKIENLVLSI